eukprot:scaffold29626_cov18-Tisochrysis_lutea.AAC.1
MEGVSRPVEMETMHDNTEMIGNTGPEAAQDRRNREFIHLECPRTPWQVHQQGACSFCNLGHTLSFKDFELTCSPDLHEPMPPIQTRRG